VSAAILLVSISIAGASGDFTLQKSYTTNNPYDQSTYSAVGHKIMYTYTIQDINGLGLDGRNDPSEIDQSIYIQDDKTGTINVPGYDLWAGLSTGTGAPPLSASATYTITQEDINKGFVTNSATAYGQGVASIDINGNKVYSGIASSSTDSVTVYYANPTLTLQKAATANNPDDPTGKTYNAVGQTITYTYTVTNSENVDISGLITVTDNQINGGVPFTISDVGLSPGDSVTAPTPPDPPATYTINTGRP